MSAPGRAVFLSYASQDAEAAKRIADALRASGVEVWFDQNELVGGDAWDAKIRKQIKECALFVPVISANTQARREGYFRLEWRLAVERMQHMDDDLPFLFPVVIDDTTDATARVPDRFRDVQWTRLTVKDTPETLAVRVGKLLGGGQTEDIRLRQGYGGQGGQGKPRTRYAPWMRNLGMVAGLTIALVYAVRPMFQEPRPQREKPAAEAASAPLSESQRLVEQGRELISMSRGGSSKWEAAALLCERALALDPVNAEALALASQVDARLWFHARDRTPQRSESARSRAARALDLAPKSLESRLAQATYLVLVADLPQAAQAEPALQQLRREFPPDARVLSVLANILMGLGRYDEALAGHDEATRLPGNEAVAFREKAWDLHRLRRVPEMDAALERSIQHQPTGGNVALRVRYDLSWHGDLDRALANLSRLPPEELAEDNGLSAAILVYRWGRDSEALLRLLGTVPRDWIWWGVFGPKAALTGDAHAAAGRLTAARTDWRTALALTEQKLAAAPNDSNYLEWKAYLHGRLGESAAAQEAYQRLMEAPKLERWTIGIEKLAFIAPVEQVVAELERRVAETITTLEQKRHMTARLIAAADLRLSPDWDPVRAHPRFQALLAKLEADPRFNPKAAPKGPAVAPAKGDSSFGKASAVAQPMADKSPPDQKSVAVLAFANLSDDKANEYFSDGISEELLNVLAKVPGLKVSARTSAFHFKGKDTPISEIARQLGVAYVVEGSVRKAGDKVRITAQLIKAADGFHVWSDTFTRDLKDVFAVQDEISSLIAQNLKLKLAAGGTAGATANPEAYRLYLEGRREWNQRNLGAFDRAEVLLNQAIDLDPGFARAHAALADVWLLRAQFIDEIGSYQQRDSVIISRILAKADQALALDPKCAEAYATLGSLARHSWDLAGAQAHLERAIELNPGYATAHQWLSSVLFARGYPEQALTVGRRSVELDPLSHRILDIYSDILQFHGRHEEVLAVLERARALNPTGIQIQCKLADALLFAGRRAEALAAARVLAADTASDQQSYRLLTAIGILADFGFRAEAEALLGRIPDGVQTGSSDRIIAQIMLGHTTEVLARLDEIHTGTLDDIIWDYRTAGLRAEPAFKAWQKKVGLAEGQQRLDAWMATHHRTKTETAK